MVYVEYYNEVTPTNWQGLQDFDYTPKLVEACGDRSVVVLDGRNSLETMHNDARVFNGVRRPTYAAYRLMKGESFTRSSPISNIIEL